MLSFTSDYALRAVLVLAQEENRTPVSADEIARRTGAPRNYLAKTLNALAKAGVVTSARGPLGGFALAASPESITLASVIDCFGEARHQPHCLLGTGACDGSHPCAAHKQWSLVQSSRRAPLVETTVSHLLSAQNDWNTRHC